MAEQHRSFQTLNNHIQNLKIRNISFKVKEAVKNNLIFLPKNAFDFAMQTSFGYIEVLNSFSLKTRHKLSL